MEIPVLFGKAGMERSTQRYWLAQLIVANTGKSDWMSKPADMALRCACGSVMVEWIG
jgi:hypothetical protein